MTPATGVSDATGVDIHISFLEQNVHCVDTFNLLKPKIFIPRGYKLSTPVGKHCEEVAGRP